MAGSLKNINFVLEAVGATLCGSPWPHGFEPGLPWQGRGQCVFHGLMRPGRPLHP